MTTRPSSARPRAEDQDGRLGSTARWSLDERCGAPHAARRNRRRHASAPCAGRRCPSTTPSTTLRPSAGSAPSRRRRCSRAVEPEPLRRSPRRAHERRGEPLAAGSVVDGKYAIVRACSGRADGRRLPRARHPHRAGRAAQERSDRARAPPRRRARTLAEGRVLGQIDHPNVVHLKAVVVEDEAPLACVHAMHRRREPRALIDRPPGASSRSAHAASPMRSRLFRQIASGIAAAHAEGVIHRDLKPANVLIRRKDQVAKVTDFGIAKVENDGTLGRVQTRGVIGSVWYMSPEQVTGRRDLDKRVDIYALGIVLFQMLTGACRSTPTATTRSCASRPRRRSRPGPPRAPICPRASTSCCGSSARSGARSLPELRGGAERAAGDRCPARGRAVTTRGPHADRGPREHGGPRAGS